MTDYAPTAVSRPAACTRIWASASAKGGNQPFDLIVVLAGEVCVEQPSAQKLDCAIAPLGQRINRIVSFLITIPRRLAEGQRRPALFDLPIGQTLT